MVRVMVAVSGSSCPSLPRKTHDSGPGPFYRRIHKHLRVEGRIDLAFKDLREFIDAAGQLGEVKHVEGADPMLEIGAITEVAATGKASTTGLR